MKNFDFDDWRRRYLRWMHHNKARIMDFFRRQDRDRDGRVTRKEFIDGIFISSMLAPAEHYTNITGSFSFIEFLHIQTLITFLLSFIFRFACVYNSHIYIFLEFPTSKLEMEAVANIFDKDGDGFINYKEFVAALRPDREVSRDTV